MNWWIARNLIYRPVVAMNRFPVFRLRKEFETDCHSRPEEVEERRLKRLRRILSNHGINTLPSLSADRCEELLHSVIPQSKDQLLRRTKSFHSRARWRSTSGSTGAPFQFPKDRISLGAMEAMVDIFYSWHGCGVGTPAIRVWGSQVGRLVRVIERIRDDVLNRTRISAFDLTSVHVLSAYARALRKRPKLIVGYPSALVIVADLLRNNGIDTSENGIAIIVTTGEMLFPRVREYLQKVFNARVINEYGSSEVGIIGFECVEGRCHVAYPNLVVEFLRSDNDPTHGEVLVTDLFDEVTPFLRYRQGDVVDSIREGYCSCGLWWPWLEGIKGRQGDVIVGMDGKLCYSAALGYFFSRCAVERFYAEQVEIGKLMVYVERKRSTSSFHVEKTVLENFLGGMVEVTVCPYEERPPSTGGKRGYFKGLSSFSIAG